MMTIEQLKAEVARLEARQTGSAAVFVTQPDERAIRAAVAQEVARLACVPAEHVNETLSLSRHAGLGTLDLVELGLALEARLRLRGRLDPLGWRTPGDAVREIRRVMMTQGTVAE